MWGLSETYDSLTFTVTPPATGTYRLKLIGSGFGASQKILSEDPVLENYSNPWIDSTAFDTLEFGSLMLILPAWCFYELADFEDAAYGVPYTRDYWETAGFLRLRLPRRGLRSEITPSLLFISSYHSVARITDSHLVKP